VSAATYDAARLVAGHQAVSAPEAEEHARELLGALGDRIEFDWSASSVDQVVVRVSAPSPARMIQGLSEATGLGTIERTVQGRVEELR
jgi:hypothetical protein